MKTQRSLVSSLRGIVLVLTWQIIYEGVASSSCQSLPCLYYSNTHSLQAIEISSSKVHSVVPNLHSIEAVDVHVKLNLVYWSEAQPNAIRRLNITSGKVEDVLTDRNLGQIEGIAVEWESGLIYWTDYTNQRIEVAQLDGKNRRSLMTQGIRNPRGISVDPRNGYIFWISRGSQPRIERATLSGHNKRTLVNLIRSFLFQPNGITIDFSGNRLYWIDAFFKRLESIDLNGNNRQYFKTLSTSSHPYDIVLYDGVFYFSDATRQSIGKIDQATKQSLGSYTGLGSGLSSSNVLGMAMFSPLRQPNGSSACHNNGGCRHLCLLLPVGSQCACPTGVMLKADGKTCDNKGDNVVNITFKMTANQWKDDTFRESISRAFTEYCSSQRPCNLRNSLEDATSRRTNPIDTIVFRPDDVMVLRRYPEEQPGMFSVVSEVLVPSNEPQMAQRETIPAVLLYRTVVKTSKRISKYMGNIDIIFINGEKDPSCVSDVVVKNMKDKVITNGGKTGQRRENLSSGGIAGVAVGAMLFLIFIIIAAVFYRRQDMYSERSRRRTTGCLVATDPIDETFVGELTTQDQLPHTNNGRPNLERHRMPPVETVEVNGSYSWNMETRQCTSI